MRYPGCNRQLLVNKGGQGILRKMHNTHSAIYLQEQKTRLLALNVFFFRACFATKMQIAYVAHKAPIIWPTKNNFPCLLMALLGDFDRLQLKGQHIALTPFIIIIIY